MNITHDDARGSRRNTSAARPIAQLARRGCIIAWVCALAGCAGVNIDASTGTEGATNGTSGRSGGASGTSVTPSAGAALVGRWSHILFFESGGALRTSETLWTFDAQGVASRLLVVRNLSDGYSDATVAQGRWSATSDAVTIRYTAPDTGTVTFAYRVESGSLGTTLYLDATPFVKSSP